MLLGAVFTIPAQCALIAAMTAFLILTLTTPFALIIRWLALPRSEWDSADGTSATSWSRGCPACGDAMQARLIDPRAAPTDLIEQRPIRWIPLGHSARPTLDRDQLPQREDRIA